MMLRLLMVAQETEVLARLRSQVAQDGLACAIVPPGQWVGEEVTIHRPDLVLVEIDSSLNAKEMYEIVRGIKEKKRLPVIALIARDRLDSLNGDPHIDDFITSPCQGRELILRAERLVSRARDIEGGEIIQHGGLLIDLARCEVTLEGKIVELTFKEYELLRFLASHPGRVYSREALLNQVWGYDYYGGDRTVDVHVRRLRSKIEDAKHAFIETVRNIGYRFRA